MTKDDIQNYIKTLRAFLVSLMIMQNETNEQINTLNIKLNQLEGFYEINSKD
jgi:hypothetical protein